MAIKVDIENSENIDVRIVKFIKRHHVMTLATAKENEVWCCNLFYAYDNQRLVFTSKSQTRHIIEGLDKNVGVSIVLESKVIGNLQGAQIIGLLTEGSASDKKNYLKRFPYAAINLEDIWAIQINGIKFTDNKLGFGKKIFFGKCK